MPAAALVEKSLRQVAHQVRRAQRMYYNGQCDHDSADQTEIQHVSRP
jgi:hypothetical protein